MFTLDPASNNNKFEYPFKLSKYPTLLLNSVIIQGSGSSGTEVVPPVPETPAPVDKSLKILASSIEGMKHWSQYTDFVGFMMFEMFGK